MVETYTKLLAEALGLVIYGITQVYDEPRREVVVKAISILMKAQKHPEYLFEYTEKEAEAAKGTVITLTPEQFECFNSRRLLNESVPEFIDRIIRSTFTFKKEAK